MSYSDTGLVGLFAPQHGFAAALSWPCSSLQVCMHSGFGAQKSHFWCFDRVEKTLRNFKTVRVIRQHCLSSSTHHQTRQQYELSPSRRQQRISTCGCALDRSLVPPLRLPLLRSLTLRASLSRSLSGLRLFRDATRCVQSRLHQSFASST